ncbi:MAG TPA: precorrin-6A reductase [Candidatus Fimadaptatus faecigallinarum]|uniref:Precorrin-6A reductase n=1 Tax=Candidatus Fimadaptatus faecigallinarum TaxID=2840814 RepID=A0A9D1S3D6_9FIRM|nr:precorrin-6A reductase [Candidatus Fimadaptatus faecigallinarum]
MDILFGGTTEGRMLAAEYLARGETPLVCVTSEYARALLPQGVRCHVGALDEAAMQELFEREQPARVIDATHPFAVRVTDNIKRCCMRLGIEYKRIERMNEAGADWRDCVEWVADTQAAAEALARTQGNVLLTTGSHTLGAYVTKVEPERLYARVLPMARVLEQCESLGLPPGHVVAMQGPFTREFNAALYDMLNIAVMVSKDSGDVGGVTEKVLPALERGIHVIMIARPE